MGLEVTWMETSFLSERVMSQESDMSDLDYMVNGIGQESLKKHRIDFSNGDLNLKRFKKEEAFESYDTLGIENTCSCQLFDRLYSFSFCDKFLNIGSCKCKQLVQVLVNRADLNETLGHFTDEQISDVTHFLSKKSKKDGDCYQKLSDMVVEILTAIPAESPFEKYLSTQLEKTDSFEELKRGKTEQSLSKFTNETSTALGEKSSAGIAEILTKPELQSLPLACLVDMITDFSKNSEKGFYSAFFLGLVEALDKRENFNDLSVSSLFILVKVLFEEKIKGKDLYLKIQRALEEKEDLKDCDAKILVDSINNFVFMYFEPESNVFVKIEKILSEKANLKKIKTLDLVKMVCLFKINDKSFLSKIKDELQRRTLDEIVIENIKILITLFKKNDLDVSFFERQIERSKVFRKDVKKRNVFGGKK